MQRLGPGGEARRAIRAALTDDARYGLVAYLAYAGAKTVATEALVRAPIRPRGTPSLPASWRGRCRNALPAAIARPAAITEPVRIAAMLARHPRIPILRAQLRRLAVALEPRHVPLL